MFESDLFLKKVMRRQRLECLESSQGSHHLGISYEAIATTNCHHLHSRHYSPCQEYASTNLKPTENTQEEEKKLVVHGLEVLEVLERVSFFFSPNDFAKRFRQTISPNDFAKAEIRLNIFSTDS